LTIKHETAGKESGHAAEDNADNKNKEYGNYFTGAYRYHFHIPLSKFS
jgi:hypothetical protein